jgi:hypothetical protein
LHLTAIFFRELTWNAIWLFSQLSPDRNSFKVLIIFEDEEMAMDVDEPDELEHDGTDELDEQD